MPVRIYDLAKKLGLESKEVIAKAKELGITAAKVPSSSLDKITAEYLEEQFTPRIQAAAPAPQPPAVPEPPVQSPPPTSPPAFEPEPTTTAEPVLAEPLTIEPLVTIHAAEIVSAPVLPESADSVIEPAARASAEPET